MKNVKKLTYLITATTITTQIFSMGTVFADTSIQTDAKNIAAVKTVGNYNNTIVLDGCIYKGSLQQGFILGFDTNTMKLKTEIKVPYNAIHPDFRDDYVRVELYDKNNDLKYRFSMAGTEKINRVKELDNVSFSYGDRIKIYHRENSEGDAYITGNVKNRIPSLSNHDMFNNYEFEIRTYGLKQIKQPNILNNQIILSGKKYQSGLQGFRMRFDMDSHKIIVDNFGVKHAKLNSRFKDQAYIRVDQIRDGEVIESVSLKGNDKVEEALNLQNMSLEFGDQIKIHHAEAKSLFKVTGNVENASQEDMQDGVSKNTITFELTKNGLSEVN